MTRHIKLKQLQPGEFWATVPFLGGAMYQGFQADGYDDAASKLRKILARENVNLANAAIVNNDDAECEMDCTFLCSIDGHSFYTKWDAYLCAYEVSGPLSRDDTNFIGHAAGKAEALRLAQGWIRENP